LLPRSTWTLARGGAALATRRGSPERRITRLRSLSAGETSAA
jgi:hypothetical protein